MTNFIRNPHLDGETFFRQGNATGVLLVHGFTATTAEVRLLGDFLHARGYTISAPLLPGHGTTPEEMNRCRWQDWTNAVECAYCDLAARCQRVFIGGESMGAVLSLYTASNHPEAAGVLLYAPAIQVASPLSIVLARLYAPFKAFAEKPVRAATAVDPRWKGYAVNPLRAVVQLGKLQRATRKRLAKIHQPVFIAQGRLDQAIDPRSGQIILDEISSPQKELHWFERSTHCVILDQEWEQIAERTAGFIARVISH
ncbi:MAG: alpha/beta fold hydrolase [Chloroflexi bacterium]|nr:alpha/beta fold hydrolase [Chloroflexota bacterium]